MVKGLQRFRDHFQGYRDQFVLIGGTACDVLMAEAGLAFRATKDLDIVLHAETSKRITGRDSSRSWMRPCPDGAFINRS